MSHHIDWTSHRLCYYGADTGLQLKLRDHCHKCMQTRQCRQAYWLVWQHCPVTTYRATLPLWPLPPSPPLISCMCVCDTFHLLFTSPPPPLLSYHLSLLSLPHILIPLLIRPLFFFLHTALSSPAVILLPLPSFPFPLPSLPSSNPFLS